MTKEKIEQIRKDAERHAYNGGNHNDYSDGRYDGYQQGATTEAEKTQCLIEALEKIYNEFEHEDYGHSAEDCPVCIAAAALSEYSK